VKVLLTAISGARLGANFMVEPAQSMTFGRTDVSNVSFGDDFMSSTHFEVENFGDRAELRDCGSTNGTFLNDRKVQQATLREGDRIRAGTTNLTVEFLASPALEELVEETPETPEDEPIASAVTPYESRTPAQLPPSTDRSAESVRLNPFDSIDFVEAEEPKPNFFPQASFPSTDGPADSPISDSSFSIDSPTPIGQERPVSFDKDYQVFERRTGSDAAEGFAVILDSLSHSWSTQLILHFQKIRSEAPVDLLEFTPLYDWMSKPEARVYSPIKINWSHAAASDGVLPLLPRLCRADACLAFLGKSADKVSRQIERMLKLGVEGFSEPNGFLPFFWPSTMLAMLDATNLQACNPLFSNEVGGVLMCSPWDRHKIVAVADTELGEALSESKFTIGTRLIGR
jgi:hypothetical protein